MLDTLSLVKLIQKQEASYQSRYNQQKNTAADVWQRLIADRDLQQELLQKNSIAFSMPLDSYYRADRVLSDYAVCAIDGSQIYPDRHEGFSEYLINIGTAHFIYNLASSASLHTKPYLFSGFESGQAVTPEMVNAQRTAYELMHAVSAARHESTPVIMVDGALMFWHLQTPSMQERFLPQYLTYLNTLYTEDKQYLGYISASHSRELVKLLEEASRIMGIIAVFDHLVDTDIMKFLLEKNQYTQLFTPVSALGSLYPTPLRPCFMYIHVGSEIARIELPEYLAKNHENIMYLVNLTLDQVAKGHGYPVALSEAHEQAVVKAADRDFFYTALREHHQYKETTSLKLSKKRSAAV